MRLLRISSLIVLFLSFVSIINAQVAIGTSSPDASARLQVDANSSTNAKGFLPPRVTSSERVNIASPAPGLLVYQTDGTAGFYYYNGSAWVRLIIPTDNVANVTGTVAVANGGTGTTTGSITGTGALTFTAGGANQNIALAPSGTGSVILNSNVGIGTTSPTSRLNLVGGGIKLHNGFANNTARPSLNGATIGNYEVRGVGSITGNSQADAGDDGFLRLSAGGGTNPSTTQSSIDISGFSTNSDMHSNIVMRTAGAERLRINASGNVILTGNLNVGSTRFETVGGDEGGEIEFGVPQTNTALSTRVVTDIWQNKFRIFDGNTKGVYVDLSKAPSGVAGELTWKASGVVDAGTFVQLDNLKVTCTASGNRGLSIGAVSTTFSANIGGTFGGAGGSGGTSAFNVTYTTAASSSTFNWHFAGAGDISTYIITDTTNNRAYRVTLQIGFGYNNNLISIERLH